MINGHDFNNQCSESATWNIRPWTPEDHATVCEWREKRGAAELPLSIVPPLAVIVEQGGRPLAFAACYECKRRDGAGNVPLALLEWVTTKPGMTLLQARLATSHAIACLESMLAESHGGAILITYCGPALSREAVRNNFTVDKSPLRQHIKAIQL